MVAVFRNGKWIDDAEDQSLQGSPSQAAVAPSVEMRSVADEAVAEYEEGRRREQLQLDQEYEKQLASGGDTRPFWSSNPLADVGRIAANAGISIVTDYADLVAGIGDVAVQTGSLVTGNGWNWDKVFDDTDNPWTAARRNAFKTESQAGQVVSNIVRVGVAALTFPKTGSALAVKGVKLLGGADNLDDLKKGASGVAMLATKLSELVTKYNKTTAALQQAPIATKALDTAIKGFQKKSAAYRAADIALQDRWLFATFKDVANGISKAPELGRVAEWGDNLRQSAKALNQFTRTKFKVNARTIGEALAWDAFIAFNVYGEGDNQMDETLGDLASSSHLPWLRAIGAPTTTVAEDSALMRKAKQMLEGVPTGIVINSALDMVRVYRYAKNFRNASPEDQKVILEAMNANAQEIGNGIGRSLVANDRVTGVRVSPLSAVDELGSRLNEQRKADFLASRSAAQPPIPGPAGPGGQIVPFANRPQAPTEGVPADMASPVQNRLAQMEGLASQLDLNDDPLYQEWLLSRAPAEDFMPPATPGNPALQQFEQQGPRDFEARMAWDNEVLDVLRRAIAEDEQSGNTQRAFELRAKEQRLLREMDKLKRDERGFLPPIQPDDLPAYRAWLEAKARMPEAELDPRVQQSLRRLDQIGELVPSPGGQLAPFQAPLPGAPAPGPARPPAGLLPGGPESRPGGANAGLLGAGGGPPVMARIEPVRVSDVRPPEPAVTPQTIRQAFEVDAFAAWKEAQELTLEQGADGVFRGIGRKVEQLMPRSRVDALEYLQTFSPVTNRYGVINAADSVWTNFLYDKAIDEGWASIDPETMSIRFNRSNALQLDRADVAISQGETLDEIRYQEWLWNKEAVNGSPQMRPEVQDSLGKMAARDEYDAWEAQQKLQRDQLNSSYDAWEKQQSSERLLQQQADEAAVTAQQFDNAENQRLADAAARQLSGDLTDDQAVREYTGSMLDSIEPPTVQKVEGGRGWEVFDRNGELLGQARTKAAAQKLADQQAARDREALIAKARQLEADSTDQAVNQPVGGPVYDGSVMGKIQLTDAQIKAVQGISPQLDSLLDEAWVARRGGSAFYNINDLGAQKRTFEIEQGDMLALRDALQSAIRNAGALKGSQRLRALKNLADKLDTQIKLLEPQARAKRFADGIIADTEQFLKNGEHCDFF